MSNGKVTVKILAVILAVMSLGMIDVANVQQSAEELYEAAIFKKDADGDLEGAIKILREIVERFPKKMEIAAQAQLQIGLCYEKLGQEKAVLAQEAFQMVIVNYPAQIEAVQVAKEKLALLQKSHVPFEKSTTNPKLELVWEGPEVELMGAVSPDGRYICYTDWDTGDLAIHDLRTGENRRLTGQVTWDGSFAENSRWSPDGQFIAFTWTTKGNTADLRIVGLNGGKPRVLLTHTEFPWLSVEDWSPDGQQILLKLHTELANKGACLISLISITDGSIRHLKKLKSTVLGYMKFSPDGKFIALDYQNEDTSRGITFPTDKDVHLLSVDGKTQIPFIEHPADDYLLGWSPDGQNILFASDRSGAVDAWILPVAEGKTHAEPLVLHKGIGTISPLGFTRDGAFFYGHGKDLKSVYVAALDHKQETFTATYKKVMLPFEGRNDVAEFSPNGMRLAFVRAGNRSGTGPGATTNNVLCIFSLETREEKVFPLNIQVASLRWAPDGSAILVCGFHEMKSFVGLVDVDTGITREIFPSDEDIREKLYMSPDWSPDGRSIYCVRIVKGAQSTLIAKNLESDLIRVIYEESSDHPCLPVTAVSPDGIWVASYEHPLTGGQGGATERTLRIISTRGGEVRELCKFTNATNGVVNPRWSADGRYIFFPGIHPGEDTWDVWYESTEGGEPKKMGLSVHRLEHISPHPDGSQIAFTSFGPTLKGPEVWVMENFLPTSEGKGKDIERRE